MKKLASHLIKLVIIALLLLATTACHHPAIDRSNISIAKSPGCRSVHHKLGEICIPIEPKRIIALDPRYILDPLLSLGIKPIGFAAYIERGKVHIPGVSFDEIKGMENVGAAQFPSLEKILLLKPDLILALDIQDENKYKQLSAIAPTVLVEYDKIKYSFKEHLRSIAQLFDREERAKIILSQYQQRIDKINKQLDSRPDRIKVSALLYYNDQFWDFADGVGISQVLADLNVDYQAAASSNSAFSIETINKHDVDILFINSVNKPLSSILRQHPLLLSLEVVKNNRAYVFNSDIWWSYGPMGIDLLLDDLERYLVKLIEN